MPKFKRKHKITIFLCILLSLVLISFFVHEKQREKTEIPKITDQIPFTFKLPEKPSFSINNCNITKYGAVSKENIINTQSIQKAINDCAQKGGGTVSIPAGKWTTGAIQLKSNIDLDITEGATLMFSTNPQDYLPTVFTRIEGMELYNYSPFIYAKDAQNITITGKGTLDGQGATWMSWKNNEPKALQKLYNMAKKNIPVEQRQFGYFENGLRPSFVQFINCQNIWLEDFTIINSPRWTLHPVYSENISMNNLHINTDGFNTDGIVIDSSKNILIENSTIASGDDTISIKSGMDSDGWRVNKPAENIVIRNSQITAGHSAIAIGSEMSGGIKNIFLYNLKLDGIDQGIRAKSVTGRGGVVENLWAKNIAMGDVVNAGIKLDLTYDASTIKSLENKVPTFRNFYFDSISIGKTKVGISLDGLPNSKISNVYFSNIKTSAEKAVIIKNAKDVTLQKINNFGKENSFFNVEQSDNISY